MATPDVRQSLEYRFGGFRVVPERGQILKGSTVLSVTPKAVAVLIALIERADGIVSKAELMELVWPGIFVEEGNVKFQIRTIRQALGPDVIETVGKAGYRFAAALEPSPGELPRTNLPARSPKLFGREADLELLAGLLQTQALVSLLGTGGVGKTTLAEAAGRLMLERGFGTVWRLDVSGLTDADAIAAGFGVLMGRQAGALAASVAALAQAIGTMPMLLILDACEHRLEAAAAFAGLLCEQCPALVILATSRVALGLPAERQFRLAPLAVSGVSFDGAAALDIPAVALLLDRAAAADARFALDPRDLPQTLRLCRLLDGLPLALEIVGKRLPVLGLEALSGRLGEFHLDDTDPLRHALDFSWSMLAPQGRFTLSRLAVLGGSFDLAAAASVIGPTVTRRALERSVEELANHSLLVVEPGRPPRYRLLDTTRAFARARLGAAERLDACRAAAAHFADLLAVAEQGWQSRAEVEWRDELVADLDCIRSALGWAVSAAGDPELALMLAGRSAQLWLALGLAGEGRYWLDRAFERAHGIAVPPAVEAAAWRGLGAACHVLDPPRSAASYRKAASLYRSAGHRLGQGGALVGVGSGAMLANELEAAERTLGRARALLVGSQAHNWLAICLESLAYVYAHTDRPGLAQACLEEALDGMRRIDNKAHVARIELNLADLAFLQGDAAAAVARAEAGTEHLRAAGGGRFLAWGLANLATYLEASGDLAAAGEVAAEALPLAATRGDVVLADLVELIALLGLEASPTGAARLIGWVDASTHRRTRPRQPSQMRNYVRLRAGLAGALSAVRLQDAMAEGGHWTNGQVVELAGALLRPAEGREPGRAARTA